MAAALVRKRDLVTPQSTSLIRRLEDILPCPVMLVARDDTSWTGARVYADFEAEPYFYALLQLREVEWCELRLPECEMAE